jgi:hypothetical protein
MTSWPVAVRRAGNRRVRIKKTLVAVGVQHDIRWLCQPALVMRAQPIHSLECFLNRCSAVQKPVRISVFKPSKIQRARSSRPLSSNQMIGGIGLVVRPAA